MKLPLDGGCLCRAVRYRISAAPIDAGYCHCRMCQRSAGAPVVAWLTMASEGFAWTKGAPAVYRSSPEAERLFCGACGTQMVFRADAEPFVDVLPPGSHPETRSVRGANTCRIAVHQPQDGKTVVVLSVIDNLVKGAAGQAIQNMNIMFDLPETAGLEGLALLP